MEALKKKVIPGSIDPRWKKSRVVKWLEIGAIPAIIGMWFPDWAGQYIHKMSGTAYAFPPSLAFPPVIVYVGALILWKACLEGAKDMGLALQGFRSRDTGSSMCRAECCIPLLYRAGLCGRLCYQYCSSDSLRSLQPAFSGSLLRRLQR